MNDVVFVGGTWSGRLEDEEVQWWEYWNTGTFAHKFTHFYNRAGYAFQWSGDLKVSRWRWSKPWQKAAKRLISELKETGIHRPVIVAHSHGGNVALHAIALGLEVEHLITLATPPRGGVPPADCKWTHIVGSRDWTTRFGMLLDGRVSTRTTHKRAKNIVLKKENHASVHKIPTWTKHDLWAKVDV